MCLSVCVENYVVKNLTSCSETGKKCLKINTSSQVLSKYVVFQLILKVNVIIFFIMHCFVKIVNVKIISMQVSSMT